MPVWQAFDAAKFDPTQCALGQWHQVWPYVSVWEATSVPNTYILCAVIESQMMRVCRHYVSIVSWENLRVLSLNCHLHCNDMLSRIYREFASCYDQLNKFVHCCNGLKRSFDSGTGSSSTQFNAMPEPWLHNRLNREWSWLSPKKSYEISSDTKMLP